nr:MAG TPA: hypothetical protein [Caudoviricetes sp.]
MCSSFASASRQAWAGLRSFLSMPIVPRPRPGRQS